MKASPKIGIGIIICLCLLQYSCKSTQKATTSVPAYENPYRTETQTTMSQSPSAIYEPTTPTVGLPPKQRRVDDAKKEAVSVDKSRETILEKESTINTTASSVVNEKVEIDILPAPYPPLDKKTNHKPPIIANSLVGSTDVLPTYVDEIINKYKRAEIYFKVQVAAFGKKKEIDDSYFKQLQDPDIQVDLAPSGVYRYTVGFFKTYEAALAHEQGLKQLGYTDAFVTAYDNQNNRINKEMTKVLREYEHGY